MREGQAFESNSPSATGCFEVAEKVPGLSGLKAPAQNTLKLKSHNSEQKYRSWGHIYKQLRVKHKANSCLLNQSNFIQMDAKDPIT